MTQETKSADVEQRFAQAASLLGAGNLAEALALFEGLIGDSGRGAEAALNAGQIALALNEPERAIGPLERIRPGLQSAGPDGAMVDHPVVAVLLARAWRMVSRTGDALAILAPFAAQRRLDPDGALEWALILAASLRVEEALAVIKAVLAAQPDNLAALCHGGKIAIELQQFDQADEWLSRAAGIQPGMTLITALKAKARYQQDDNAGAYELLAPLRDQPDLPLTDLYFLPKLLRHMADWDWMRQADEMFLAQARESLAAGRVPILMPFDAIVMDETPGLVADLAAAVVASSLRDYQQRGPDQRLPDLPPAQAADRDRRLRIGYLSSQYRAHAGMNLKASMFQHHDRDKFEVVALSCGEPVHDKYRKKVEDQVDEFIDIEDPTPLDGARAIRAANIDVLIELRGFTEQSRLHLCLYKPAPISATWLGYPGPVPAGIVDYQIVDPHIAPPQHRGVFGPALAFLPHTYQVTDNQQLIGDPIDRDTALPGVGDDKFVLACFCQTYKVQPAIFDLWLEILLAVPHAVLWLWADQPVARQRLKEIAAARGIDPDRLIFAERAGKAAHLARVAHADLVLDTWPYGGHVTTTDMLWAGVPVITKDGTHFASRVSQSLLSAAGLPELVAPDAAGYRDLAIELATDPDRLSAIRSRVAEAKQSSHLFDTKGRVRELEALYRQMWARHCDGADPADIHIST